MTQRNISLRQWYFLDHRKIFRVFIGISKILIESWEFLKLSYLSLQNSYFVLSVNSTRKTDYKSSEIPDSIYSFIITTKVEWLADETCCGSLSAGTTVRDSHHRESMFNTRASGSVLWIWLGSFVRPFVHWQRKISEMAH